MSDSIVEQTYQALVSVVQTTAVTRKVLRRPPFTFLHKLLVETLGGYDLFTSTQLDFFTLVSKEDKAAFLTRALAFVTFAMANTKEQCVSCLLLVSPIKVLAGVAVDDTLEFLLQLCVVCKTVDRDAKETAAQQVVQKGDALLYKSSVSFRRGLILVQAVIRTFIRRRVGKRRAIEISARSQTSRIPMSVGTRFLKELPHGRIYDGTIQAVRNNRYTLVYDQDPEAQDDVDEIEMKIILEESQRLTLYRDRISESGRRISKRGSKRSDDVDISLTSLPDLSAGLLSIPVRQSTESSLGHFTTRVSSGDSGAALLVPKFQPPMLQRALSQRPAKTSLDSLGVGLRPATKSSADVSVGSTETAALPTNRLQTRRSRALELVNTDPPSSRTASPSDGKVSDSRNHLQAAEDKTWQASLKKLLDDGRQVQQNAPSSLQDTAGQKAAADGETHRQDSTRRRENAVPSSASAAHVPNFPKLGIPGTTKSLAPSASKRRLNDAVATTASSMDDATSKPAGLRRQCSGDVETPDESVANPNTARYRSNSVISLRGSTGSELVVDAAFTRAYQSTDQKTQERLAFIRDVVMHIDSYMKRKRLRVIDLFRFCDADGNGSISPQEMIDTLSQMEIQLTPEQGQDFVSFIDKDGNGSIDIDEFEELVRVARRSDAQREHLKREPNPSRRGSGGGGEGKASGRFVAIVKAKQRILDEFKSLTSDGEGVSESHLRSMIANLALPNVEDACINALVDRALGMTSSSNGGKNVAVAAPLIKYEQLAKTLDDLEWAKKANRFLNQAWIAQFDAHMERAAREFDLL